MPPKRERKDFMGFILAIQTNEALVNKFFSITDKKKDTDKAEALYEFFKQEGFTKINKTQCEEILKVRIRLEGANIPSIGDIPQHGKKPCGPVHGY